jgi:hypothetical protein
MSAKVGDDLAPKWDVEKLYPIIDERITLPPGYD